MALQDALSVGELRLVFTSVGAGAEVGSPFSVPPKGSQESHRYISWEVRPAAGITAWTYSLQGSNDGIVFVVIQNIVSAVQLGQVNTVGPIACKYVRINQTSNAGVGVITGYILI